MSGRMGNGLSGVVAVGRRWGECLAALWVIGFLGYNLYRQGLDVRSEWVGVRENLVAGRPWHEAASQHDPMTAAARVAIPPGSRAYYWSFDDPDLEVSRECQAITLNYYLYPSRVGYRDEREMLECDFIITDVALESWLLRRLAEMRLVTGLPLKFSQVHRDDSALVLRREGR